MEFKDYYQTLGVPKTASEKEPTVGSVVGLIYNPHFKG